MKNIKRFRNLLFLLFLFSGNLIYAQDECKVLMPQISGSYSGECKKGLAHGQGTAVGVDSFEGQFSKGLPHGTGKYAWADGSIYEGSWKKGVREGIGTMIYKKENMDSTINGMWKDDVFVGNALVPPYRITRSSGVLRSSINKLTENGAGFRIGIYQAGRFNTDIEDFSMVSESGVEYQSGRYIGLENAIVPYAVSIRYRTWNALHTQQSNVVFEFIINERGSFEISITN